MLTGTTSGPVDYNSFGGYTLFARRWARRRTTTCSGSHRASRPGELAVATYNVENLARPTRDTSSRGSPHGVVDNLASPDIVALEEIQDNNGATNDGMVAADQTLKKFTDAIVAAGGPHYEWR